MVNGLRFKVVLDINAGGYVCWDTDRDEPLWKNKRKRIPRVWERLGPAGRKATALNRKALPEQRSLFR